MINTQSPPFLGVFETALVAVIDAFAPSLQSFLDEAGQPDTVPIRAEYADARAEFSEVVVAVRPGTIRLPLGGGYCAQDPVTGGDLYMAQAEGSSLVLTVKARSAPERFHIVDTLVTAFLANATMGQYGMVERSVQVALAAGGILCGVVEAVVYREPDFGEARPEGQVYEADIAIGCTISLVWETPPYVSTAYAIRPALWGHAPTNTYTV